MDIVLGELGESKIEKHYSWRLNERHYGALQGLNKADSAKKWGDEQVHIWRRSADVQPPKLTPDDPRFPGNQAKYQDLVKSGAMSEADLPLTECLVDTAKRVKPYFDEEIAPALKKGEKVLIAAHDVYRRIDKAGDLINGKIIHPEPITDRFKSSNEDI